VTGIDTATGLWEKLDSFDESQFTLSYEYNGGCHCHPEYSTYEQSFPSCLLGLEDEALDEAVAEEVQKRLTLYFEQKARQEKAKADEKAKRKKEDEDRDRKIYLELNQRFGGGQKA
jgi:hypothetical protein